MSAGELIAAVDALRPNHYDSAQKLRWLAELDGKLFRECAREGEAPAETYSADTELLAPFPYDQGLYTGWLFCQIDLNNAEILKYNQSMSLFASAWRQLADHWNRTRTPGEARRWAL